MLSNLSAVSVMDINTFPDTAGLSLHNPFSKVMSTAYIFVTINLKGSPMLLSLYRSIVVGKKIMVWLRLTKSIPKGDKT